MFNSIVLRTIKLRVLIYIWLVDNRLNMIQQSQYIASIVVFDMINYLISEYNVI